MRLLPGELQRWLEELGIRWCAQSQNMRGPLDAVFEQTQRRFPTTSVATL